MMHHLCCLLLHGCRLAWTLRRESTRLVGYHHAAAPICLLCCLQVCCDCLAAAAKLMNVLHLTAHQLALMCCITPLLPVCCACRYALFALRLRPNFGIAQQMSAALALCCIYAFATRILCVCRVHCLQECAGCAASAAKLLNALYTSCVIL
jgi:hypothetical protein